jgi:hypothetical protein
MGYQRDYNQTFDTSKDSDSIAAIRDHDIVSYDTWVHAYAHLIKTGLAWKLKGRFAIGAQSLIDQNIIDKDGNILNYFDE